MVVNDSVFPNFSSYLSNNATLCDSLYLFLDMKLRESLPSFYIVTAIAVCVLNGLTACSALPLNAIAVLTILLIPELRQQPKNFLLCSLAVSDFFVGLLCQPSFIMAEILLILGRMDLYCYTVFFHFYTSWVFLWNFLFDPLCYQYRAISCPPISPSIYAIHNNLPCDNLGVKLLVNMDNLVNSCMVWSPKASFDRLAYCALLFDSGN